MGGDTLRNLDAFVKLDEHTQAEIGDYIKVKGELRRINKISRGFDDGLCVYVDGDDDFYNLNGRHIYRAKGGDSDRPI